MSKKNYFKKSITMGIFDPCYENCIVGGFSFLVVNVGTSRRYAVFSFFWSEIQFLVHMGDRVVLIPNVSLVL